MIRSTLKYTLPIFLIVLSGPSSAQSFGIIGANVKQHANDALALMCRDGRLDFTDLMFPLFLLLGGWHLREVHRHLDQWRDWNQPPGNGAPLDGLKQRFRYSAAVVPALMIGLFAADILLPGDVIATHHPQALTHRSRRNLPGPGAQHLARH